MVEVRLDLTVFLVFFLFALDTGLLLPLDADLDSDKALDAEMLVSLALDAGLLASLALDAELLASLVLDADLLLPLDTKLLTSLALDAELSSPCAALELADADLVLRFSRYKSRVGAFV